jgi:hypothetical protein
MSDTSERRANARALEGLTDAEHTHLDSFGWVRTGKRIVWRLPNGDLRSENAATVYYLGTTHGVFRLSKLTGEVVEV